MSSFDLTPSWKSSVLHSIPSADAGGEDLRNPDFLSANGLFQFLHVLCRLIWFPVVVERVDRKVGGSIPGSGCLLKCQNTEPQIGPDGCITSVGAYV